MLVRSCGGCCGEQFGGQEQRYAVLDGVAGLHPGFRGNCGHEFIAFLHQGRTGHGATQDGQQFGTDLGHFLVLPGGRARAGSGLMCSFQPTATWMSGGFTQDAQVSPAGAFGASRRLKGRMGAALRRRLLGLVGQGGSIPHGVGKGKQVVGAGLLGS